MRKVSADEDMSHCSRSSSSSRTMWLRQNTESDKRKTNENGNSHAERINGKWICLNLHPMPAWCQNTYHRISQNSQSQNECISLCFLPACRHCSHIRTVFNFIELILFIYLFYAELFSFTFDCRNFPFVVVVTFCSARIWRVCTLPLNSAENYPRSSSWNR